MPRLEAPEFIPTKPCRPERQLTCTHAQLRALRAHGIEVFECAHAWVDDASISYEFSFGQDQDLARPHSEITNRAGRIATMVRMMERGVRFDPLFLRVGERDGRLALLHLADGHHRLRAVQWQIAFCNRAPEISFNVGGNLATVACLRALLLR